MGKVMKLIAGLFALISGQTEWVDPIYDDKATFPQNLTNMQHMLKTMPYFPEARPLEFRGRIPKWVSGTFYRNGPGIYEYGEDKYNHFFDPTAILQGLHIKDQKMTYNSNVVKSRNYQANMEYNGIVKPEIGTYGEPDWVTKNPDGTPINDPDKEFQNRIEFFQTMGFATDNTLIQVYALNGYLISMTETMYWNYHDPYTMETLGQLSLAQAKNFPEKMFCVTNTAHPHIDLKDGTMYNVMGCLELPGGPGNLKVPRSAYLPYKILNAGRSSKDQFLDPPTPQDFLDSIEFGTPFYNPHATDLYVRYFHMTSITENYLVIPLNSLAIEFLPLMEGVFKNTEPLANFMKFADIPGEFVLVEKSTMKALDTRFYSDPFLMLHFMNSYEDPEDPSKIIIDGTMTDGDIIEYYFYKYMNASGDFLIESYANMTPIGVPHRYVLDLNGKQNLQGNIWVDGQKHFEPSDDSDFPCYEQGGVEFVVSNFYEVDGYPYDHYWACGFGEVLPDRLYHVELSTGTRHVWQVPGYSPGEPAIIDNPYTNSETDGVLVSLVSPYKDENARAFYVFLNPADMTELGRAYLPADVKVPSGFHGYWVPDDNVPV